MGFDGALGQEDSPDLRALKSRPDVQLLSTRTASDSENGHMSAEALASLQRDQGVDVTVFIEADKFSAQFRRIAAGDAPRLEGRNLAIFAATSAWYPGEDVYTGERLGIWGPTLRRTLGNIRGRIFRRHASARFFFERLVMKHRLVDEILVKDERLASWEGDPVVWMPEISRPLLTAESAQELAETARVARDVKSFLANNRGREPLLYFGDPAYYKGYDHFLAYIAAHPDLCALHAGRGGDVIEAARCTHDVVALRRQLVDEGRLFELGAYVSSQGMKQLFFESVRIYVTTHRLALSSSTVIQAAEFGRPVLVPDRGLLAHRVQTLGIGRVYRYGDFDDMHTQAQSLWGEDLASYAPRLAACYARFDDDAIRQFWRARLLGA